MTNKPTFATNRAGTGETVAQAINDHVAYVSNTWARPPRLSIATAYINPGGLHLLEGALVDAAGSVRLLLGAEPLPPTARIRRLEEDELDVPRALVGNVRTMLEDRNLLGFTYEEEQRAREFVVWLRSDAVEVRRFEGGFLHGKAYLVDAPDDDDAEGVLAGSSNLTYAGLATNYELNLGLYDPPSVNQVREWYEEMWGRSVDYKHQLIRLYGQRFEEHSPYLIYLRMLYEKYGAEVEALAKESAAGLALASFQQDGVTLANWILERYSGVVVADGVGLGKTYIAGELIRQAVVDRRQRVLVVAPAALRDGPWRAFKAEQLFNFEVVSFEELAADSQLSEAGGRNYLAHPRNEYALVVVDEAHAFRNLGTLRALSLERLLEGFPPKNVVLLTATPVNNSLWDLYNLLAYFVRNDATFASVGIPSLRERFKEATALDPDDLDPSHLYDVLSPVVVRRTRSYVRNYYPDAEVNGRRIVFPVPRVRAVNYELTNDALHLLGRLESAMTDTGETTDVRIRHAEEVLTLARYVPSRYLLSDRNVRPYEAQLAGLLQSGLLKRFESSAHAFANTCETMARSGDSFLELLDRGYVASGEALQELTSADADDLDELIAAHGDGWTVEPASDYDAALLRTHVETDQVLLRSWAAEARVISPTEDPKLQALRDLLLDILRQAKSAVGDDETLRDKRKVIIFSYFADTVRWVADYLEIVFSSPEFSGYRDRVAVMEGAERGTNSEARVLFGFAPRTTEAPPGHEDTYDVLVTTDVLSEGVNLQQAQHVINFDLPWNPMRLVQRNGRIDRIGSSHREVFSHCFMPDAGLDRLLNLEQRLRSKISQAAASVGIEGEILPGSAVNDQSFTEPEEVIRQIREGEAAFLNGPADSSSVEEFRQQLRTGLDNPSMARLVRDLAWGSGSGKVALSGEEGYIFCARVGDHRDVQFRYVSIGNSGSREISMDVLTCLRKAAATGRTERRLDEESYAGAFAAWAVAREDIHQRWTRLTDIRNLQPEIPKAMRDAVALIDRCAPDGLEQQAVENLRDTLNAPYPERILRQVRQILGLDAPDSEKAVALVELQRRLALTAPPDPEPLPVIGLNDVHLVAWMALVPEP